MSGFGARAIYSLVSAQGIGNSQRGIGRYLSELYRALMRLDDSLICAVLLDDRLPLPKVLNESLPRPKILTRNSSPPSDSTVFHITSPMDRVPLEKIWPRVFRASSLPTTVSVFDLIPLQDFTTIATGSERRRYRSRLSLLESVDQILAISDQTGTEVARYLGVPKERIRVVGTGKASYGRQNTSIDFLANKQVRTPYVFASGNLETRKNLMTVLYAYSHALSQLSDDINLVVHCSSDWAVVPVQRKCKELGIENVTVLGRVSDDELFELYRRSTCFVFPSVREGFGLPIVEAQASGAIVLGSHRRPMSENLSTFEYAFNPFSPLALTDQLIKLLSGHSAFSKAVEQRSTQKSWDEIAFNVAMAYKAVARV